MDASILLKLDVFTLMIMALGGYSLGFITLSIIWSTHREIPGLGYWWWSSLFALAAQSLFTLQAFMPSLAGIWLANLLITVCIALMPLALQRFFGQPLSWSASGWFMLIYVLILSWSIAFNDQMAPRVLLACLSYMVLGAVIVFLIWRHGYPAYLPAVLVFTVVNILLYGFNLLRMAFLLQGDARVLMDQSGVNVLPFLSMLMGSYLSTFGVLLLCTQYRALALRQQASHDPLTGLLNRRGFMELMARRRMTEFGALAVLDLDDFKQINDRHGHEMGDRVLAAVGAYLGARQELVASRFGGEEFVLLLPKEDETAQQQRCEQIIRSLAAQDMHGIGITVSMGLVRCEHSWHFDTLFSQADRALYQAKREGKNRVCRLAQA
ncbi:TPA: diguanylate cyclase [Aeromonas hydrophila]|uniref:GGDEF domain-containing protein n=1 Tax=Aeromonas hydrophila TaxID=644 RepID=UPI00191EBF70|nr:GGDEF domain-containing protein [Aeromonas hydrophila]MBL0570138.1 GGDEF domain-containing protein [Aeromonas hydrophila]